MEICMKLNGPRIELYLNCNRGADKSTPTRTVIWNNCPVINCAESVSAGGRPGTRFICSRTACFLSQMCFFCFLPPSGSACTGSNTHVAAGFLPPPSYLLLRRPAAGELLASPPNRARTMPIKPFPLDYYAYPLRCLLKTPGVVAHPRTGCRIINRTFAGLVSS